MDQETIDRLRVWLASEEGQAAIRNSLQVARQAVEQLQRERCVDPVDLRTPMTV